MGGIDGRRPADAGWSSFNKYFATRGPSLGAADRQLRDPFDAIRPWAWSSSPAQDGMNHIVLAQFRDPRSIGSSQAAPGLRSSSSFRAAAEAKPTPFEHDEADFELVAGFATEYSGMRFGFLFFRRVRQVYQSSRRS